MAGGDGMIDASDEPAQTPEHRPISWEARKLIEDHAELASMGPAEVTRYCGRGRDRGRPQ